MTLTRMRSSYLPNASVADTALGEKGNLVAQVDVHAIRARTHLSQTEFARRFGFSASALREWEQGRWQPEAPVRLLLTLIDKHPDLVLKVLDEAT